MDCLLIALIFAVMVAIRPTRRFTLYMLPWFLFGFIYSSMRFLPNYEVNPIDVKGLYDAEKTLFGITTAAGKVIPGEWFATHHWPIADFMAGLFTFAGYRCRLSSPYTYISQSVTNGCYASLGRFSL